MKGVKTKLLKVFSIKDIAKGTYRNIKFFYYNYFSITGIKQNFNHKNIPIIIISFNQLYYLKQLIDFLKKHNYSNIVIIDNNSSYPPLLDYFDTIETTVTLHRLNENFGHLVFWENKELFDKYSKGYYVVTDADIVPVENCPDDFMLKFKRILKRNSTITKVGFSLKTDNIPDSNLNKNKIIKWESQYWKNKNKDGDFISHLDTTFALYKPGFINYQSKDFYFSIRTNLPYIAIHGGWYFDFGNLTPEQVFYTNTANQSASWLVDENGNLTNKLYT